MSVGFETLSGIISSAVENWITNTLDEKAKAFFDKEKIDAFRQDIEKDVREYINFHDGTVLTTGAFETFLSKYNVVESFFSYVSGGSTPASKDELIKIFSKLFIESGTVRKQVSWESKQRIHDFLDFLYQKIDAFFKSNLSDSQRYILHKFLSSNEDIKKIILENTAKILDELLNNTGFRKIIKEISVADSYNASPFHYLNKHMSNIYGRDKQLSILQNFLNNDMRFSFCVITGPGGIGKSKLAYSFMQGQKKSRQDWKMFFINEDTLNQIANCNKWNHDFDTLLIIDYAGISLNLLHKCFVNIANNEKSFAKKLRIILLDRIGMVKKPDQVTYNTIIEYPNWFKAIVTPRNRDSFADPEYIKQFMYGKFIELEGLSEEDYKSLIKDFATAIKLDDWGRNKDVIHDITEQQIENIIEFTNRTSPSLSSSRPVYIMLATDAVLNGGNLSEWNTNQLMKDIYTRDRNYWKAMIGDAAIFRSLENALVYATIFGEWTSRTKLFIAAENAGIVIERGLQDPEKQGAIRDWLKHMGDSTLSVGRGIKICAYEPDVVGEFYVLNQLKDFPISIGEWYDLIFMDIESSSFFFERACQDFVNSNLRDVILGVLQNITKMLTQYDVEKADYIIRLWDAFLSNVNDKAQKALAVKEIRAIAKKYLCKSKTTDEFYVKYFINEPAEHSNTWREKRFDLLEKIYNLWPDSLPIAATYIEMLGALASWYYRNGNLERGNNYSKKINGVISNCDMDNKEILIVYVNALGNIISGHYYMNDVSDTEAEIDDPFKLDTLVNKLYTEAHAVAYVDAIRKVITQQAKYSDDARITRTVEQFCIHVYKWSANSSWYIFHWSIGVAMPYAINLLLSHGKIDPADILLDAYVQIIGSYISKQYCRNDLMIHHFSQGIDKLTRSNLISDEQRKKICEAGI